MLRLLRNFLLLTSCVASLIPREKLVSPNSIKDGSIVLSPDGKNVGFIVPDDKKIHNVFIWKISERLKRQVTFEESNVAGYYWTGVQDVIIYSRDNGGDENYMMFKKNISEGAPINDRTVISNRSGVNAEIVANNNKDITVLIGLNDESPSYHNVYKYDLITNEMSLVFSNSRFVSDHIYKDNNLKIRIVSEELSDGTNVYYRLSDRANPDRISSDEDNWEEIFRVSSEDSRITKLVGFDKSNKNVYWIWGEDSDLGSLVIAPEGDISKRRVLYAANRAEMDVFFHPEECTVLSISENYHKPQYVYTDGSITDDLQYLQASSSEHPHIMGMTTDAQTWLITYSSESPSEIFIYNRKQKSVERLFNIEPELEVYSISKKIGFNFTASDGLQIQAYLSLPPNTPLKNSTDVSEEDKEFVDQGMIPVVPQKMVLLVHGGPDYRDVYGFEKWNTFLTSRGYAVLQVNFRGSIGFGKDFYNAGNGEWSRKMHSDLLEAVEFTVQRGIANRSGVAIMGGSYGGYATLAGLTFTPEAFACGIDLVGPSNLVTLVKTIPPTWQGFRHELIAMTGGDPDTEEGRQELFDRSPLFIADRVKKPLLIMQGSKDPRVKQEQSDQFAEALANHSIPFTYVRYPDEGHGFSRLPNELSMFGYWEKFLHECLGGEYQPFTSGQYNESAIMRCEDFASAV